MTFSLVGDIRRSVDVETLRERFNKKWIPEPFSGCWLWTAGGVNSGYGVMKFGAMKLAHRVSWFLFRGQIPDSMQVLHKCDTRCCVNPDHLFLGTQKDNMQDCAAKKRNKTMPGEKNGQSKLTSDEIGAIRSDNRSLRTIAADYGVRHTTIHKIKRFERWNTEPPSSRKQRPVKQTVFVMEGLHAT